MEFKSIINESRRQIADMDGLNNQIRMMAQRYFEASENAEKFIHNYQELKLNIDVPYAKRVSLHQSVLNTMSISQERKSVYRESIAGANDTLSGIVRQLKSYAQ